MDSTATMKVSQKILDLPFWKHGGGYVSLGDLVEHQEVQIGFLEKHMQEKNNIGILGSLSASELAEATEVTLHSYRSIPEEQRRGIWTPSTGIIHYEQVIEEITQGTEIGRTFVASRLLHILDLYSRRAEIVPV